MTVSISQTFRQCRFQAQSGWKNSPAIKDLVCLDATHGNPACVALLRPALKFAALRRLPFKVDTVEVLPGGPGF